MAQCFRLTCQCCSCTCIPPKPADRDSATCIIGIIEKLSCKDLICIRLNYVESLPFQFQNQHIQLISSHLNKPLSTHTCSSCSIPFRALNMDRSIQDAFFGLTL
jgi:hypothetical protein